MSGGRHSAPFEIVVLVGSQGAMPVARDLIARLPPDFPAAVVYVQHRMPTASDTLAWVLSHHARLPVRAVTPRDAVRPGTVYVPTAGVLTTIDADRTFRVADGRCEGDPLLGSVAAVYGPGVVGVVLSGRLRDGSAGLRLVKQAGGRGLIQAPETADADGMPLAAMATGCYDFVLAPTQLHAALTALVTVPGAADLFGVRANPVVTTR